MRNRDAGIVEMYGPLVVGVVLAAGIYRWGDIAPSTARAAGGVAAGVAATLFGLVLSAEAVILSAFTGSRLLRRIVRNKTDFMGSLQRLALSTQTWLAVTVVTSVTVAFAYSDDRRVLLSISAAPAVVAAMRLWRLSTVARALMHAAVIDQIRADSRDADDLAARSGPAEMLDEYPAY